ncbi:hypothetical protein ACSLOD_28200, partial [Escherichia coli]
GKKQRRERNHRLFLAAGLLIEAGLVDTKTGELRYKKDRILQAKRGRKGGIAKGEAYDDKRFMALCMLENGYSQKAIAAMLEV